jgi:hypothetical protein
MDQPIKLDLLPGLRSLSAAADRDDASEESKFDDVKALQEELVTVSTHWGFCQCFRVQCGVKGRDMSVCCR